MLAPIASFAATPALASMFAASRPSSTGLFMSGPGYAETGRFRDFADYAQHREQFMREKTAQLAANREALKAALDKSMAKDANAPVPRNDEPAAGAAGGAPAAGGYTPPAAPAAPAYTPPAGYAPPAAPAAPQYGAPQQPQYQPPQQPQYQPPQQPQYQPPAPAYQPPAAPPSGGVPGLY